MANDLTPAQIERDNFLRRSAIDPAEGLRQWKRLTPGEPAVVVTYMTLYYDTAFAEHFKKEADRRTRPDLDITITNLPEVTPTSLGARGFKLQRTLDKTQIWVHPTGNEVWLLSRAKAVPPPPVAPTSAHPHPDIQEIQLYVTQYSERKEGLIRDSKELQGRRSQLTPEEYRRLLQEWFKQRQQWEKEVIEILEKTIPSMTGELTPDEQKVKQKEIDRLKAIQTSWPPGT